MSRSCKMLRRPAGPRIRTNRVAFDLLFVELNAKVHQGAGAMVVKDSDKAPFRELVGARIAQFRKRLGITMRELAKRVGISQAQLSRLESGKQGLRSENAIKVAKALDIPPYELFVPETAEGIVAELELTSGLAQALKDPQFVAVLEGLAVLSKTEPEKFRMIADLVRTLSSPDEAASGEAPQEDRPT